MGLFDYSDFYICAGSHSDRVLRTSGDGSTDTFGRISVDFFRLYFAFGRSVFARVFLLDHLQAAKSSHCIHKNSA